MRCPVCNSDSILDSCQSGKNRVMRCQSCSSEFLKNYKQNRDHIYSRSYYDPWNLEEDDTATARMKHLNFQNLIDRLEKRCEGVNGKKFLDIGCATGYMLDVAREKGCEVYGVELSTWACTQAVKRHKNVFNKSLEECSFARNFFDFISMTDVLEHIDSPHIFFEELNRIIKRGGYVLITTPDNLSWSRRCMGRKWFHFNKDDHIIFYNRKALSYISGLHGFQVLEEKSNRKVMCMDYLHSHFMSYRVPIISESLAIVNKLIPKYLRNLPFKVPVSGELVAILKKK